MSRDMVMSEQMGMSNGLLGRVLSQHTTACNRRVGALYRAIHICTEIYRKRSQEFRRNDGMTDTAARRSCNPVVFCVGRPRGEGSAAIPKTREANGPDQFAGFSAYRMIDAVRRRNSYV
jgi:hypothetical protein